MNTVTGKRKKRRLKKSVKRVLGAIMAVMIILISIPLLKKWIDHSKPKDVGVVRVDNFKDLNATHLKHAKKLGISPIETDNEAEQKIREFVKQGRLDELTSSKYFIVDKLSHSHPYLTPAAIELLHLIGRRFHQKLDEKKMDRYQFRVTSVLRTRESQKKLRRSNGNATTETSHLYGTTFDIGWKKIYRKTFWGRSHLVADGPAIKILSETIGELRKEGYLVVVTEMKEACLHITIARE
jgi:uncharacterized protein YcbK (DUF882 family)